MRAYKWTQVGHDNFLKSEMFHRYDSFGNTVSMYITFKIFKFCSSSSWIENIYNLVTTDDKLWFEKRWCETLLILIIAIKPQFN